MIGSAPADRLMDTSSERPFFFLLTASGRSFFGLPWEYRNRTFRDVAVELRSIGAGLGQKPPGEGASRGA
jgi:hypothetical protein